MANLYVIHCFFLLNEIEFLLNQTSSDVKLLDFELINQKLIVTLASKECLLNLKHQHG